MNTLPQKVSELPSPPPSENLGKKILMFGNSTCPDCARAKKFFTENKIEYEYHDVETEKEYRDWLSTFSQTVPIIIFPDGDIMYEPPDLSLHQKLLSTGVGGNVKSLEPQIFDTIIIGAGPAGISAAIYAVRKSLKVLIIAKEVGGQAIRSGDIENLLGFTMITGVDLAQKFRDELNKFKGENMPQGESGIWLKEGSEVTEVTGTEGNFTVRTTNSAYLSKTVIVASGRIPRMSNVPGEKEFFGKGVATCATCDAPLYKSKDVVVVGGGNSALDTVLSLINIANLITIVNVTESLKGDEVMLKKVLASPKVKVLNSHQVVEIIGKQFVEGVNVQNMQTHTPNTIPAQGVFIEIGWVPSVSFIPQAAVDKQNQIIVDESGKTSVPGIWACGDVNNLWGEQIVIAAGEGAKVALFVAEHIAKIPHQQTSNIHMG